MNELNQEAAAWKKDDQIIIHPYSLTTEELWIMAEPVKKVSISEPKKIGEVLLNALKNSRVGVPHPTTWEGGFDPVFNLAGVKNWRSFSKGTKCVGISLRAGVLVLTPEVNMGAKEGFKPISEKKRQLHSGSAEAVGKELLNAFLDAE